MAPKKFRGKEGHESIDLFTQLPIEIIQTIQSFLTTTIEPARASLSLTRFLDTKEATRTSILSKTFLQAWSTIPDLNFADKAFIKHANTHSQEASEARETFANYVHQTLIRYQQHNLPIRSLSLDARVHDEKVANILEQCIFKAKETDVKEVYIHLDMVRNPQAPSNNLLKTIFALKKLVSLNVFGCNLVKNDVQDYEIIKCSSLRKLELDHATINEELLQNLIRSCPLIESMQLRYCRGPETILVANLPNLKRLSVFTFYNQLVDVKAASLKHMTYGQNDYYSSPYLLTIDSTQNLKTLILESSKITDEDIQNLIVKCPVLEEVVLEHCYEIEKINVSGHLLSSLCLMYCGRLMEVKIDAPNLNKFEYVGHTAPSLSFASGGSEKRKSSVTLYLADLEEGSSFLELREFLMMFKCSDDISLFIESEEISFYKNIIDDLNDEHNIPEFEEVYITVSSPSSTYSTLMEGLLWSFSPKILTVRNSTYDDGFIEYLCKELLVEYYSNSSTSSDIKCWRNYFKQAKFEGKDDEWHPLLSWKYLIDALPNYEDDYILKLSHP